MYVSAYVCTNIKSLFFLQNVANPAAQILCAAMLLRYSCSHSLHMSVDSYMDRCTSVYIYLPKFRFFFFWNVANPAAQILCARCPSGIITLPLSINV